MTVISLFTASNQCKSRGNTAAALASGGLHLAAATVLAGGLGFGSKAKPAAKHYRVQLLQFEIAPPNPETALYFRRPLKTGQTSRISASQSETSQTLMVPDAPPDLRLERPMPLPLALPALEMNAATELASAPPASALTNSNPPPKAKILSVPDDLPVAAPAVLLPKVNQSAANQVVENLDGNAASPRHHVESQPSRDDFENATLRDSVDTSQEKFKESPQTTRIDLPANGEFPVSVLGPSVSDQYPDVANALGGKIVSTVYLQVGLSKSWTLEFWAPGTPAPDAPWAYEIYRPDDLKMPPETDAVLVSGTLNPSGQLADLRVLLPLEWPTEESLLPTLSRWKFRPAMRNGQPVAVQILIVIPCPSREE